MIVRNVPISIIKAAKEYDLLIQTKKNIQQKINNDLKKIEEYMIKNNIDLDLDKFIKEVIDDINPGQVSIFDFLK